MSKASLPRAFHIGTGKAGKRWCLTAGAAVLLLLAACSSPQTGAGSCSLNVADGVTDEEAVAAVLRAEGELMVAQQIDALMLLWVDGSYVADAKNTPDDQQDDQYWRDKDAIRHRYVRTVFPGAPQTAAPADLEITIDGPRAQVLATTNIGAERSPAGDRWTLVKVGGCWLIESLTYNLEAQR
jgi:hypothetical protein